MPKPNMQPMKQMFQFPMYQKSPGMQGAAGNPLAGLMDNSSSENMPPMQFMQSNPMTEAQAQEYFSKPMPPAAPTMEDMLKQAPNMDRNPLLDRYRTARGDYEI